MSLSGECRDINGFSVKHGLVYTAGPGLCHQCTCESGIAKHCQDIMCHQPQNCSTFRKGARCCDFVCLDDIPPVKGDANGFEDFGPRLIASVLTAILSFSILFFLVHRFRQRKIRVRQNRQLSEDERSLGSIGYITGSLGYLPGAMERYEEPSAHFPHYPLWKPPGNYFPRGEAPPPYEEAVAATRAEALAAAMASGSLHTTTANINRDAAHLGINYNTYATSGLLGAAAHRTIPMNLATSASFTLQPERYEEIVPSGGGTSSVSVATGTVSVTATVTAPPIAPVPDLTHAVPNVEPGIRTGTLRRSDVCPRTEASHRADIALRPESCHRPDGGYRHDVVHRAEVVHRPDSHHRIHRDRRQDNIASAHHREVNNRGDERRLPSIPLPENSLSLPSSHHSHGGHLITHSYNNTLSHPQPHPLSSSSHIHSFGHQLHQLPQSNIATPIPVLEIPAPLLVPGSDLNEITKSNAPNIIIPPVTSIPKSGTGVYEDVLSGPQNSSSMVESYNPTYTATLRRGKHSGNINGSNTRRAPVPVAVPTPTLAMPVNQTPTNPIMAPTLNAISVPPPTIPLTDSNPPPSAVAAAVAAIVAASPPKCTCSRALNSRCGNACTDCHSNLANLTVGAGSLPRDSNLSLSQAGADDNDDYRSECENCKSTHSSNYYLDAEDPEPEITMTLHRKPTETGEENVNGYYRTSLTLPTRHRVVPLHGTSSCGARENWFSSMPESSTEESEED